MKYRVLKPVFTKTFEKNEQGQNYFRVKEWQVLGFATNMQDAKRLHPAPVLEVA